MTSDQGPSHQDVLSWGLTGHIPPARGNSGLFTEILFIYTMFIPPEIAAPEHEIF